MCIVTGSNGFVLLQDGAGRGAVVAPVTGNDVGLRRAGIKPGVREVITCKDGNGRVGLRVRAINGVRIIISFISEIQHPSPILANCKAAPVSRNEEFIRIGYSKHSIVLEMRLKYKSHFIAEIRLLNDVGRRI